MTKNKEQWLKFLRDQEEEQDAARIMRETELLELEPEDFATLQEAYEDPTLSELQRTVALAIQARHFPNEKFRS